MCHNQITRRGAAVYRYSAKRRRGTHVPPPSAVMAIACGVSVLLGCHGGANVALDNLVVVEVQRGVRVHKAGEARYVVGGDPINVYCERDKPSWRLPSVRNIGWPPVVSGDFSARGDLAVSRCNSGDTGLLQVFNSTTGTGIVELAIRAAGLGWSRDGSTLAVAEEVGGRQGDGAPGRVFLWKRKEGEVASWAVPELDFTADRRYPWDNVFVVDWSPDDRLIAISTEKTLRNNMRPGCVIISLETATRTSSSYSDVHFVGPRLLLGNRDGQVGQVWLLEAFPGELKPIRPIRGPWFVAGADPTSGRFLAWHPLPLFTIKAWTLPLMLHDLEGNAPVRWQTGGAIVSRFRMFNQQSYERAMETSRGSESLGTRGTVESLSIPKTPSKGEQAANPAPTNRGSDDVRR